MQSLDINQPKVLHTVLVVDDEPVICELVATALAMDGHATRIAHSAEAALERLQEAPAEIVFLDYYLPGMSGGALCREIKRRWPRSVAIAMTGEAAVAESQAWRENGFTDCLSKPFGLEALLRVTGRGFERFECLNAALEGGLPGPVLAGQGQVPLDRFVAERPRPVRPEPGRF